METHLRQKQLEAGELNYRLVPSTRLATVIMAGLGQGVMLVNRLNVCIAVVCMVADDADSITRNITSVEVTADNHHNITVPEERAHRGSFGTAGSDNLTGQGEFDWDKTFQGLLLSSFFYGYTAALFPGGWVSDRLPAQLVILFGVGSQGVASLLFPVAARTNAYLLLILRAVQGIACAGVLPACIVLIRNWSMPNEYSTLFAIAWSQQYLFSGFTFPISSLLCQTAGWPMVFYVTGCLPLVWAVFAWFTMASSPGESSLCSDEERRCIVSQQLCRQATVKPSSSGQEKLAPTPILAIVTNRQVLIVVGSFFFYAWFYYSLNITLPTFLKEAMDVDLTENGILSGLPTVSMTGGVLLGGRLFQYLLARWKLTRTVARKLISTFGMLVPAALLGVILVIPPGSTYTTMALLCAANVIAVLAVAGGPLSAGSEIGPQYAGIIWGLAGSIGNLPGVLAPTVASAMTPNKTLSEWRYFFLISVVGMVFMNLIIAIFWKSELQPFARTEDSEGERPPAVPKTCADTDSNPAKARELRSIAQERSKY